MAVPQFIAKPTAWFRRVVLGLLIAAHAFAASAVALRLQGRDMDDLWNVELWGLWRPFSRPILVPRDTFVLHAPVNIAARALFGEGVVSMAAGAIILNAIGIALVLQFVGFVGRRASLRSGPLLGLQVVVGLLYGFVSIEFLYPLGRPNHRNIEIGLFLLAIELVVRASEGTRLRRSAVWVSLALGLFAYNDPMFLICGIAAWLAVIGFRWLLSSDTAAERRAAIILVGGTVAFGVLRVVLGLAGVHVSAYAAPEFSNLIDTPRAAFQTIELFLINFGASFSNRNAESLSTWFHLLRLGLLMLIMFGAWRFRRRIPEGLRPVMAAVAVPIIAVVLASTFSTIGSFEGQNPRYLAPADGLTIVLASIPLAFGTARYRRVLVVLIVIVASVVGLDAVRHGRGVLADGVTAEQFDAFDDLAEQLDLDGATVGYAAVWVAIPTEYFAESQLDIASIDCGLGVPVVANMSNLGALQADAERSFVVLWDRDFAQCTRDQIVAEFGSPVDEERFEFDDGTAGHFDVLWFDGNPGTDLEVLD